MEYCITSSYRGKAVNSSLLYSLYGTPDVLKIRHKSAKGFLFRETVFIGCYWATAGAAGATFNDAQVQTVFTVSRSGTVRLVGCSGYAFGMQGGRTIHERTGSQTTSVLIFDITDPLNWVLVYSWGGTLSEPGGILEFDDRVNLNSGRFYLLSLDTSSTEHMSASDGPAGPPAVLSAYVSGSGGTTAVLSMFYEKGGSTGVPSEIIRSDVNGDRCVDDADLLAVLFCIGNLVNIDDSDNPAVTINQDCLAADVNMDGVVDDADLLMVLFNLGTCY
jgi:hypothetical protein